MLSQHRSLRGSILTKSDSFAPEEDKESTIITSREKKREVLFRSATLLSSHRGNESFASSSKFVSPTKGRQESKLEIYNRTQRPWVIFASYYWFHLPIQDCMNCARTCTTLHTLFVPTRDMLIGNTTLPRLHYAAYVGQLMKVKYLLYHGFLANEYASSSMTPLHYAAQEGHVEIARELIVNGTRDSPELSKNVKTSKVDGRKILHANPNTKTSKKRTTLHYAAANGRTEMVKLLIEMGAKIEAGAADRKRTPLLLAAKYGHVTTVKMLVELGANKNAMARGGLSCVHYAAKGGFTEMIEFLVKSGAVPDLIGHTLSAQVTAVQYAIVHNKADSMWKFVELGVNINQPLASGITPLHLALQTPKEDFIKEIVAMGANVNAPLKNQFNMTPLHLAAIMGSPTLTKILIQAGANVNAVTTGGYTPLHVAVMGMSEEVVKILIRANADLEAASKCQWRPIHLAIFKPHRGIFVQLLSNGANKQVSMQGEYKLPHLLVLKRAVEPYMVFDKEYTAQPEGKDFDDIANIILEDPAIDVSSKDFQGNTALHNAILKGDSQMINLLLNVGSDLTIQNKEGDTVLHLAINKHNAPLVQTLVKQGAPLDIRNADGYSPFFSIHLSKLYKFDKREEDLVPIEIKVKQGLEDIAFSWTNAHKLAALSLSQFKRWMKDAIASHYPNTADELVYTISTGKMYNIEEHIRLIRDVDALCSSFHSASYAHHEPSEAVVKAFNLDSDDFPPSFFDSDAASSSSSPSPSPSPSSPHSSGISPASSSSSAASTHPISQSSINLSTRSDADYAPVRLRPTSYAPSVDKTTPNKPSPAASSSSPYSSPSPSSSSSSSSPSGSPNPARSNARTAASPTKTTTPKQVKVVDCWLHKAAARGEAGDVEKLIAIGQNVNDPKLHGWTPIQVSVFAGQPETTFLLASRGANIRVTTTAAGNTLLHLAVFRNRLVVAKTILELGWLQSDVTNMEGDTPLHMAAWMGYEDMVQLLIQHKAHVSAVNNEGNTPLHYASVCGHLPIVTKLIHYGAKPIVENRRGETPIHFATKAGKINVEAALNRK